MAGGRHAGRGEERRNGGIKEFSIVYMCHELCVSAVRPGSMYSTVKMKMNYVKCCFQGP